MSLLTVRRQIVSCQRCQRLRAYCVRVARQKRASFRNETYWGRPVPGLGDRHARVLVLGLAPAAHGANRTGRVFTGDSSANFLLRAMHGAGFASMPTSRYTQGRPQADQRLHQRRRSLRAPREQTYAPRDRQLSTVSRGRDRYAYPNSRRRNAGTDCLRHLLAVDGQARRPAQAAVSLRPRAGLHGPRHPRTRRFLSPKPAEHQHR